ncbi:MAG: hypothetical protein WBP81_12265 [Solirubrobacteraceae bacterium]
MSTTPVGHVMLAGDATDTLEQLYARRADAIAPDPKVHIATLETIMAHCAQHPTIYLPSHDPDSAARLAATTTVQAHQSIDSHVAAVPPPAT